MELLNKLPSFAQLSSFATLVVPGLITLSIRTRVIKGSLPPIKEQIISYLLVAIAYLTVAAPVFHDPDGILLPEWLWSVLLNFAVPALIGLSLAYAHQWNLTYKAAGLLKLRLVHHVPAAWDYTFENVAPNSFVLVLLKDGTRIPGRLGKESFLSSTDAERDMLISSVWQIDEAGGWSEVVPPRSIYISCGEIRSIEIY